MTAPVTIVANTGRQSAELKACRLLLERRVTIVSLHRGRLTARIRGDDATYHCGLTAEGWYCHCPEVRGQCSHLRALRYVVDPDESREP